jgi:hypothetical protein
MASLLMVWPEMEELALLQPMAPKMLQVNQMMT